MNHQTLFNSGIQFHVEQKTNVKRMHSSRMRTARTLTWGGG